MYKQILNCSLKAILTGLLIVTCGLLSMGHAVTLRMSTPASATDQRSIALEKIFAPAVAGFAKYEAHYNGSLIKQGSELEAIASGDLEMSITSAQ